jgi:hypothetical protein|tara:strand:- start:91 stop:330 length:240 start_codon:yes stop_codon:yes gene_type:complete
MEYNIKNIKNIKQLITSKKEKYPNISNVWLKYLEKKIELLEYDLNKAKKIFQDIENTTNTDIPYNTIALLYFLNQESLQ